MNEELKSAGDHAWRYFELHAQQRMTVFNFYIAITGLLAAGVGFSMQQGGKYVYLSSVIGLFIVFISFIFLKLDERVSMLIKSGEAGLERFERELSIQECRIVKNDSDNNLMNNGVQSVWSYGRCFRLAFLIVGVSGLVLCILPVLIFCL